MITTPKHQRAEISSDTAYPLSVFMAKTGLGRKAVARMRRKGLRLHKAGRQAFVIGADFISVLARDERA